MVISSAPTALTMYCRVMMRSATTRAAATMKATEMPISVDTWVSASRAGFSPGTGMMTRRRRREHERGRPDRTGGMTTKGIHGNDCESIYPPADHPLTAKGTPLPPSADCRQCRFHQGASALRGSTPVGPQVDGVWSCSLVMEGSVG